MINSVLVWLAGVIYVEAVTEILVGGSIFLKIRNAIAKANSFFGELVGCGYCMSVWVSATIAWALPGKMIVCLYPDNTVAFVADCVIKVFVLHRVANLAHEGMKRWFDRYPWCLSIHKISDEPGPVLQVTDEKREETDGKREETGQDQHA